MREVSYKKQFLKDIERIKSSNLVPTIKRLTATVIDNPFRTPPPFEKLKGEIDTCSRRINQKHRLVYQVDGDEITFLRCWSHYEQGGQRERQRRQAVKYT